MNRRLIVSVFVLALLTIAGIQSGLRGEAEKPSSGLSVVGSNYVDVRDGRVVKYSFDGPENPGTVQNHATGRYTGRVDGNITKVSGTDGSAVRFDGLEGRIVVENSSTLTTDDGFAFAFCINPESDQQGNILKAEGSYSIFIGWNTVYFTLHSDGNRTAELRAEIPVEEWTYVTGTYDPETGTRLYVDGEVVDRNVAVNESIDSPTDNVTLNAGTWKSGFNGSVDEFSLWKRSLSETEVELVEQGRDSGLIFSEPLKSVITVLVLLLIVGVTVREYVF